MARQLAKQPGRRTCAGLRVLVRHHLSGQQSMWYGARRRAGTAPARRVNADAALLTRSVISWAGCWGALATAGAAASAASRRSR
jgi:hypothetical protein